MRHKTHKGRYRPKNPSKYKGDPTGIIYRSSWERKVMRFLDSNPNVLSWGSEEIIIPYISPIDGKYHRYFPDFHAKVKTKTGEIKTILIEVKPKAQTRPPVKKSRITKRYLEEVKTFGVNLSKWKAAEEYCKDRQWDFQILTEEDIFAKYK